MDGLPVVERVDLPFASKVKSKYNGKEVGVMHACGHDTHVAILMSVAEILAGMKNELKGTVKFIFQPAEEGPPEGEEGGAPSNDQRRGSGKSKSGCNVWIAYRVAN